VEPHRLKKLAAPPANKIPQQSSTVLIM